MKLRELYKMQGPNDGTRTLFESVMAPEVIKAFEDWKKANIKNGVLIGGVALSYYVKPRMTQDIDLLFFSDSDIPEKVLGFKHHRKHAFEHNDTKVEIETVTPNHINLPEKVVEEIIDSSIESNGIRIASASGLIASKLFRFELQDQADIVNLIKSEEINLEKFNLPIEELNKYEKLLQHPEIIIDKVKKTK